MKHRIKTVIAIALACIGGARAASYDGGLKIARMYLEGGNLFVGFDRALAGCSGSASMYGIQARIPSTLSQYKEIYALLLAARVSGESVDIFYNETSNLSCNHRDYLIQPYAAGLSMQ